ncbi:conserved hypothetical protein [Frankia sp. AiPs1]|uniref:hypothetical protein n=1 Tax=Frankia sp. AiPa1 TaxID=573492 RepID=UPI00202B57A2|nr:hypothetical protein [Frankia sp. AiPa1]MCL9760355.1 hypothetical protein [Frankia sp. AiPa1]
MNGSARAKIAAGGILPTVMAELVLVVLAAFGLVPWSVWPALVIVPAVLAVVTYIRLGRRRPVDGDGSGSNDVLA